MQQFNILMVFIPLVSLLTQQVHTLPLIRVDELVNANATSEKSCHIEHLQFIILSGYLYPTATIPQDAWVTGSCNFNCKVVLL